MSEIEEPPAELAPGWYVQIDGHALDVDDWVRTLNAPFDPVALKDPRGGTMLTTVDFDETDAADQVREKALALVARLNGAMALWNGTKPLTMGGVIRIDDQGRRHAFVYVESAISLSRASVVGVGMAIGSDGEPVRSKPEPSLVQRWTEISDTEIDLADLLEQIGRADNWYDIYKACELVQHLVKGKHALRRLLGSEASRYDDMAATANFYRHARAHKPKRFYKLSEAQSLLRQVARHAIDHKLASFPVP